MYTFTNEDHIMDALLDNDSSFPIEAADVITSISLSKDGRYLLINYSLTNPRIDLWDLNRKEIVNKFRGHKQ